MATTSIEVKGMTCGACTSAVESACLDHAAISSVDVSLILERAIVKHDAKLLPPSEVCRIIEDAGFDSKLLDTINESQPVTYISQTTVAVNGMTCGACTSAVESACLDNPAISSVDVSLILGRAVVKHDAQILPPNEVCRLIEDAGFDTKLLDTTREHELGSQILQTTVSVKGMTCRACTSAVDSTFEGADGVLQYSISLLAERVVIVHDVGQLSANDISARIEECGFTASIISSIPSNAEQGNSTISLKLFGLKNPQSAIDLETLLKSQPGIISVDLNFDTSKVIITHNSQTIGVRAIVAVIEAQDYNALTSESEDNQAQLESLARTSEIHEWRRAFRTSLSLALPVWLISMIFPMFLPFLDFGSIYLGYRLWLGDVLCLALTIPVQFGVGRRFYITAYKSLKHGSPTMDVLVAIGTSTAFFFSVATMLVSIFTPPHTRPSTVFDTSSMLITFVCMGRYLENKAKGQTSRALSQLMSLAPSMATIYSNPLAATKAAEGWEAATDKDARRSSIQMSSSQVKLIPAEFIEIGDIVVLRPGDKIPADGIVMRGESYVNESMITGEAMPVQKVKGSILMAGTVNVGGRLDFIVTKAGKDTQLSQIVQLVQEAQTSRAPIQRLADKIAGYFVSIILTLGAATFVAWLILSYLLPNPPAIFLEVTSGGKIMVCAKLCISVIVFACPCALGLATPTAVMVGTGVGAAKGILIKGGATLENATKVNHVVFDKTGTLTFGRMSVIDSQVENEWVGELENKLWWTLVGLAEMGSEHPIAKAIVRASKRKLRLEPECGFDGSVGDFKASIGNGITASVSTTLSSSRYKVSIGNLEFLESESILIPPNTEAQSLDDNNMFETSTNSFNSNTPAGTTVIYLAINDKYAGSLSLSDSLKPSARGTILALGRLGVDCSIFTGDARAPALAVARTLGVSEENVHSSCKPSDKQSLIQNMQAPIHEGGQGLVVAMVGDGINDSPALATASIGIALASGTDVAMEAASIVLMNSQDLLCVPAALHLSRYIFGRIRLNLLWACGYNVIGLPFAMGFFLPWGYHLHPMAAGGAMAVSSVSVVMSSLALNFWRRPSWMNIRTLDPENHMAEAEHVEPGTLAAWWVKIIHGLAWLSYKIKARSRGRRAGGESDARYIQLLDIEEG